MMRTTRPNRRCLPRKRVLLVEDDIFHTLDVADILAENGCSIVGPAFSLDLAFALLEGEAVDAAILDVELFDETVFPLSIELKRKNVPFIFVTAHADAAHFPAEMANAVRLKKPYARDQLVGALEQALQGQA